MELTLAEITAQNWQQCIALRVTKKQIPYIPSNIFSLAESKFLPDRVPLGIFDGDVMLRPQLLRPQPRRRVIHPRRNPQIRPHGA